MRRNAPKWKGRLAERTTFHAQQCSRDQPRCQLFTSQTLSTRLVAWLTTMESRSAERPWRRSKDGIYKSLCSVQDTHNQSHSPQRQLTRVKHLYLALDDFLGMQFRLIERVEITCALREHAKELPVSVSWVNYQMLSHVEELSFSCIPTYLSAHDRPP